MPPRYDPAAPRPEPRRRRADAQRNHDLLVATARDVFRDLGVDAPLDDIARRAGVGNATMYRHFPTRRDLIVAVYAGEVAGLLASAEELRAGAAPGDALFGWLGEFIAHVAAKRELARSIPDDPAGQRSALFDQWHRSMRAAASALLTRAQAAGAVRRDLDVAELLALANGIALTATGTVPAERLLLLVRQGLAAQAADQGPSPGSGRRRP
ncbi:TetR/AcrR family transcriptional regulator [Streptomyces sp. MS19]|uniref:TetR/AcrR family transcriptional regulator n=1 Tax=Streptomyces sp. MS19 TaxID=3385972 RepID=UPI00399FE8C8